MLVEPTTPEEPLQILSNVRAQYEQHHTVSYTEEALRACVELTERYVNDRLQPDKAIDAMDEAGARVRINNMRVPEEIIHLEAELSAIEEKKKEVEQKNAEGTNVSKHIGDVIE